jgi:hypothetical protein
VHNKPNGCSATGALAPGLDHQQKQQQPPQIQKQQQPYQIQKQQQPPQIQKQQQSYQIQRFFTASKNKSPVQFG